MLTMKYISIIITVFFFNSFPSSKYQDTSLKEMLQGYWQLKTDPKHVIFISNETLESIYKGKLKERNKLDYNFLKSEMPFFNKQKHSFEFWNYNSADFKLEMINNQNDTITQIVLYIDNKNLELGYNAGTARFKKIKSNSTH
jgi:hypothetical protein